MWFPTLILQSFDSRAKCSILKTIFDAYSKTSLLQVFFAGGLFHTWPIGFTPREEGISALNPRFLHSQEGKNEFQIFCNQFFIFCFGFLVRATGECLWMLKVKVT